MPRVYLPPLATNEDPGDGGIRQVLRAQHAHLPSYGWEIVADPADAEVLACHVTIPPVFLNKYHDKPIVVHNHGAYWTNGYEWQGWCYETNAQVLKSLREADVTTAVSEWTANTLRRHSLRDVRVVHHGVDLDEWSPLEGAPADFVLWNKTRVDPICDPRPMWEAALQAREVPFVTTFLPADVVAPFNVTVTGRLPYEEAKDFVRRAGAYLCTTRETFGIGTLEALASGVPVVGYGWGGQREIIEHGVDGWLVEPGDIAGLAEGIRWAIGNREARLAARRKAEQFPVRESVGKYAAIYAEALEQVRVPRPKVSVIVTAYNLERFLPDALDSVLKQDMDDWECIVVDDASPDSCPEIADAYAQRDPRFRVIHNADNQYLAGARNTGIEASRGKYILPLDGDDMLTSNALSTLSGVLDSHQGMHIAYGNVLFVAEDGRTLMRYPEGPSPGHSGWPVEFRLDWMLLRPGQPMPYSSMFRRTLWEQTGGYRTRARSSEDCDLWIRATSYGFVAQMVTQADMLVYRVRPGSMSQTEGWQEHRGWYPWTRDHSLLPAAAYRGTVPPDQIAFPALDPQISVVIPVGPEHARYVIDAVDSVDAQDYRLWECIVVNDTGAPLPRLPSWVRVIEPPAGRFGGVAAARNAGIRAARGALYLPLDADDMLQPNALSLMLAAHVDANGRAVVYSDFYDEKEPGIAEVYECPDYNPRDLTTRGLYRAVTALTPIAFWKDVGGYDEQLPAWEDWAFAIKLASKGYCERRVAAPLFTYRKWTGVRRNQNMADFDESKRAIIDWSASVPKTQGGELMACGTCGAGRGTTFGMLGASTRSMAREFTPPPPGETMFVEYLGNRAGDVMYKSEVKGQAPYRFSTSNRRVLVRSEDLEYFDRHVEFRILEGTPAQAMAEAIPPQAVPQLVAVGAPRQEAVTAAGGLPWLGPEVPPMPAPVPAPRAPFEAGEGWDNDPRQAAIDAALAAPAAPDVAPGAFRPLAEGEPVDDLTAARRALAEQPREMHEDPEVKLLTREHTRTELNAMAIELGLEPASFSNMGTIAQAIVGVRRYRAQQAS